MNAAAWKTRSNRLILFTRYPASGKAKTRLIPALGKHGAARIHRRMTETILAAAAFPPSQIPWRLEVRYDGGSRDAMRKWIGPNIDLSSQGAGDIGRRMQRALAAAREDGYDTAVLIGADILGLERTVLISAFQMLSRHNLVLGPARDGGYYLIGIRRDTPGDAVEKLFRGITWGSSRVLKQSLRAAGRADLSCHLLPVLQDVDRPADLPAWLAAEAPRKGKAPGNISIVIPAVNEARQIGKTISAMGNTPSVEIILADGGSRDETRKTARSHGAAVVSCRPPRSAQMNAGARAAGGDILLFLHADTQLPAGFPQTVRETLNRPGIAAGAFSLKIDDPHPALRRIERFANHRARHLQLPYGDQGVFMKKALFDVLGGFAEIPIMEDVEMVRRVRRVGKIAIVGPSVVTSARRWRQMGVWRTTLLNYLLIFSYFLGVSPHRITRWYRREHVLGRRK